LFLTVACGLLVGDGCKMAVGDAKGDEMLQGERTRWSEILYSATCDQSGKGGADGGVVMKMAK